MINHCVNYVIKIYKNYTALVYPLIVVCITLHARSVHRPQDPLLPTIQIKIVGEKNYCTLKNGNLRQYPLFDVFDKQFFTEHLIPAQPINFRNNKDASVSGSQLSNLVEQLLDQIQHKKKEYEHFIILQDKNFNRRKACGLLIVKFKDYPFVVKLFIETPKSFINPWAKGFEPIFFFYMGGGVNRHLSGFTRIKNLEYIKHQLANNPDWNQRVDTPRKWFWLPKKSSWLEIVGTNIGGKAVQRTTIPAIYAIIADAIEPERTFSGMRTEDTNIALHLSNMLESNLDPHITNFIVEKNTHKIVIIDTEHFPTMVGLKKKRIFGSYIAWVMGLVEKCAKDMLFSTKKDRRLAQQSTSSQYLVPCVLNDRETLDGSPHNAPLC